MKYLIGRLLLSFVIVLIIVLSFACNDTENMASTPQHVLLYSESGTLLKEYHYVIDLRRYDGAWWIKRGTDTEYIVLEGLVVIEKEQ